MPSKYRIILEMASQTARNIASNADRYTDFLITAANNYKYSFKEHCSSMRRSRMQRRVRKSTHGINSADG